MTEKEFVKQIKKQLKFIGDRYTLMTMKYSRQDLLDKLNEVCKKCDITSYELDIKVSEALLKNWTIEEIRDQELIMKVLNKILEKKK
jgi:hypothetical protein